MYRIIINIIKIRKPCLVTPKFMGVKYTCSAETRNVQVINFATNHKFSVFEYDKGGFTGIEPFFKGTITQPMRCS